MKRKLLSALLAAVLCIGLTPGVLAAPGTYADVPEGHWAVESIDRATQLGIFQGMGDGTFGLGQPISRAAFVTALVRLFGWESMQPETPTFTDVEQDAWYFSAVETAVKNGALPVASKTFRPAAALSRSDMAAMLMRALGYTSLAGTVSGYDCPFSDVTVNRGFITMAYDMGIVAGMGDGIYAPNAAATREQAAAILVRLYDKLYLKNTQIRDIGNHLEIRVETPLPVEGDELPTTPLEPIEQLYLRLREMKESGQDMSGAVLVLSGGGVSTTVSSGGHIFSSEVVTAQQVQTALGRIDVRVYYSKRHESAYCVYEPNFYQTVTIWYQSEESMAAKLKLARMFGVTDYVVE